MSAGAATGVVVTGAAQGLGKAIATRFLEAGHAVVGIDVNPSLTEVVGEADAFVGDAGEVDLLRAALDRAAERGAGVGSVVFNAGVTSPGDSVDYALDQWDRVVDVNLRSVFVGARTARPYLSAGGSMVMLSSIAASEGFGARASYCASKAGVDGLVRSLATEWGPDGIRVNAVAPGTFETEMQQAMVASGRVSVERYLDRIPMNRIGRPHEIADAVYFLASPQASYISGVILPVDGGWAGGGLPAIA